MHAHALACYSRGNCKYDWLQNRMWNSFVTGDTNVHNYCGSVYTVLSYNDSKLRRIFHVASDQIKEDCRPVAEVYEFDRIPERWHRSCIHCSANSSGLSIDISNYNIHAGYPLIFERYGVCLASHNKSNSMLGYAGNKFHGFKHKKFCGLLLGDSGFLFERFWQGWGILAFFGACFVCCVGCRVSCFMGRCLCCINKKNPCT